MARIRTVKPDFFLDEDLADVPIAARLLFIGLWCLADREGKLQDRPKRIKAELFPWDNVNVDDLLAKLHPRHIVRYEVDGVPYLWIRTFTKHQRPNVKEAPSQIPDFVEDDSEHEKESAGTKKKHASTPGKEGKGREGKGGVDVLTNIPAHLHSVWPDWVKSRKGLKDTTVEYQLALLSKYPEDVQIECIKTSIRNEWTGLFPDKVKLPPSSQPPSGYMAGYKILTPPRAGND